MPLDPQARAILARMPPVWHDVATMTIAKARAWAEAEGAERGAAAVDSTPVTSQDASIPVAGGTIPLRIHRPVAGEAAGIVVWYPGGGFVLGSLEASEPLARAVTGATGCVVVAVGYRQAPEHPFPTAPEDGYASTFEGLPPALVITAEYDVLRDEGEAYAERLASAGVPIGLRRYDGMPHGFLRWLGELEAADACLASIGTAVRERLPEAPALHRQGFGD